MALLCWELYARMKAVFDAICSDTSRKKVSDWNVLKYEHKRQLTNNQVNLLSVCCSSEEVGRTMIKTHYHHHKQTISQNESSAYFPFYHFTWWSLSLTFFTDSSRLARHTSSSSLFRRSELVRTGTAGVTRRWTDGSRARAPYGESPTQSSAFQGTPLHPRRQRTTNRSSLG